MDNERKPLWPWIMALLVALPVLYVLSFGPACWLNERGFLGMNAVSSVYSPVLATAENGRLPKIIEWYARLGAKPDDSPNVFDKTLVWKSAWPRLQQRRHTYISAEGRNAQ